MIVINNYKIDHAYQKKFSLTLALTVDLKDAPGKEAHSFLSCIQ